MDTNTLFMPTYARDGAPMVKGEGSYLYDTEGKKYLDFGSGIAVNALGHAHPAIVAALKDQGAKLLHASNLYHNQTQIELAQLLIEKSFGDRVFFCNSGTEAIEAAIKFSRKLATASDSEKYHVLSFSDGFHGRTYGALSATAQPKFHKGFEPISPGFHYSTYNDIPATKDALSQQKFAAVIVEPLQGESGFNQATTAFLKFLREYTTEHDIALVFDEIQCGFGRTGTLWHYEQHGVTPDMMTLAKPLGGGLPLGAVVCVEKMASAIAPGDHGTTFGGNPLACALGTVVLKTVSQQSFLDDVKSKGEYLKQSLAKALEGNAKVSGLVGMGLMVGVRFVDEPKSVPAACKNAGLLVVKAGNNTVRFMPPLTVSKTAIDEAVALFSEVLKTA
jgi:acetylornithine/N-succinyldiaminopimelate aminotransferase